MTIRDLIIDGLRQLGAVKNVVISANKIGKLKTVLQMVAISIIFLNGFPFSFFDFQWPMYLHISDFICYAATIVSIISCVLYLIQNKKFLEVIIMNNVEQLIDVLAKKGLTLGSVESFTGGLFAKTITDVSGASKVFKGALVTYSKDLKVKLLGMDEEFIDDNGLVSWGVAQQMALQGQKVLGVDVCVSFTGNAGPDVLPGEAGVGETYMAIVYNKRIWAIPLKLELEREKVREAAVNAIIPTFNFYFR